nr:putative nucleotidyltransferase, ribonuclease H [Tanacetum cinerariifolium]
MLYGRKCRALICWDQVGERVIEGPEMIEVTNKKVAVAKEKLKEARTRQKSYADKHHASVSRASLVLVSSDLSRFLIVLVRSSVVACPQRVSRLFAQRVQVSSSSCRF